MAGVVKIYSSISVLLILAVNTGVASAIPGLSELSDSDIRESAIAFVNMTTSPGLEGAVLTVDNEQRQSKQWRSSLGFNAEFTLKDHIFNGYWGLAIVGGSLNDKVELTADNGQPVKLDLTRNVAALRGSLGLSFPINQHFKLRPFLTLAVSGLQSETIIDGLISIGPPGNTPTTAVFDIGAEMVSTVGSIDALYSRWYGDNRLELSAQYNLIYNDSFSEDNPVLDTQDWNNTAQLKSRYSGPTRLISAGRPWRWHTYANITSFLSHNEKALGYKNLFEVGAGLDWELNIKPLDWFGWQYLGVRAGLIFGENVEGYNIGLTAR